MRTRLVIGEDKWGNPQSAMVVEIEEKEKPRTFPPFNIEVRGDTYQSGTSGTRKYLVRRYSDGREERII